LRFTIALTLLPRITHSFTLGDRQQKSPQNVKCIRIGDKVVAKYGGYRGKAGSENPWFAATISSVTSETEVAIAYQPVRWDFDAGGAIETHCLIGDYPADGDRCNDITADEVLYCNDRPDNWEDEDAPEGSQPVRWDFDAAGAIAADEAAKAAAAQAAEAAEQKAAAMANYSPRRRVREFEAMIAAGEFEAVMEYISAAQLDEWEKEGIESRAAAAELAKTEYREMIAAAAAECAEQQQQKQHAKAAEFAKQQNAQPEWKPEWGKIKRYNEYTRGDFGTYIWPAVFGPLWLLPGHRHWQTHGTDLATAMDQKSGGYFWEDNYFYRDPCTCSKSSPEWVTIGCTCATSRQDPGGDGHSAKLPTDYRNPDGTYGPDENREFELASGSQEGGNPYGVLIPGPGTYINKTIFALVKSASEAQESYDIANGRPGTPGVVRSHVSVNIDGSKMDNLYEEDDAREKRMQAEEDNWKGNGAERTQEEEDAWKARCEERSTFYCAICSALYDPQKESFAPFSQRDGGPLSEAEVQQVLDGVVQCSKCNAARFVSKYNRGY